MTDDRTRRSSMYVAEEQAALDLKKPGRSVFPTGADGSSSSTVSSVAGHDPEGLISEARVPTWNTEHLAAHS
jgi:hypothetical protein